MSTDTNLPARRQAGAPVESFVRSCESRFAPVLATSPVDWPAFALGVRAAVAKNPALGSAIQANPAALVQALSQAAALGLSPHPDLQHFSLVPFKGRVTALVGYRGLVELAMRSGVVDDVEAFVIYRDEIEALREARLPVIDPRTGEPNVCPSNRLLDGVERTDDDIVGAVAIARVRGRTRPISLVMDRAGIEKRRAAGQGDTPAWQNWFEQMAAKTALRALLRSGRVPLGRQADAVRRATDADEVVLPADARVVEPEAPALAEPEHFEESEPEPDAEVQDHEPAREPDQAETHQAETSPPMTATLRLQVALRNANLNRSAIPTLAEEVLGRKPRRGDPLTDEDLHRLADELELRNGDVAR